MSNQLKNPVFWSVVAFLGGMILAGWGWDKNESTIAERTHGAVLMIITGCILIIGGLYGMYSFGKNRRK